jgi:hypothetical protein
VYCSTGSIEAGSRSAHPALLVTLHISRGHTLPTLTMALNRIKQIGSHLSTGTQHGVDALLSKSPDDVVITLAVRSPLCKGSV